MQIVSQRELQPGCGRKLHKIISEAPDNYIISVEKGTYFFNFADTFIVIGVIMFFVFSREVGDKDGINSKR